MNNPKEIIPEQVYFDNTIHAYGILDDNNLAEVYFERVPTDKDTKNVYYGSNIVELAKYYGEWVDKTAEYNETHKKRVKKQKENKELEKVETEDQRELDYKELEYAEKLLAQLLIKK